VNISKDAYVTAYICMIVCHGAGLLLTNLAHEYIDIRLFTV